MHTAPKWHIFTVIRMCACINGNLWGTVARLCMSHIQWNFYKSFIYSWSTLCKVWFFTKCGKNNSKKKKNFQVKVGQFNGKSNSNHFSLLNFLSMSSSSKVISDFVLELVWAGVWPGQYWMKGIKNGWIIKISLWIISVWLSEDMVHFGQDKWETSWEFLEHLTSYFLLLVTSPEYTANQA